ncbi:MAG: radical SAM protein [Magnetococcus sp. XQGC-1]
MVARIGAVDLVAFSCSIWNWNLSMTVAREVRRQFPETRILVGGPHIPFNVDGFFALWPFLDLACSGEGEVAFAAVLRALMDDQVPVGIPGISYHDRVSGRVETTRMGPRIVDLETIPSPYLQGVFDDLFVEGNDIDWMALWETNRGCPYACSFCEWGGSETNRLGRFSKDRLLKEMEWFGEKKIGFVFGCDANFGILPRDKELAAALAETKKKYGFPNKFRVCFAKNSSDRIIDIASILETEKMLKGISLSFQSLNEESLRAIHRENIALTHYKRLQDKCADSNIVTFTELVIGLPHETYESFVDGIDALINNGQHSGLKIYNCTVLPNAELELKEYREKYCLKTVEIPIFQEHSARRSADDIVETESIIVSSSTMTVDDWRWIHYFSWSVQCFHYLGLLQHVGIVLKNHFDISYKDFYKSIIEYGRAREDSFIGKELSALDKILANVLCGIGFDQFIPGFEEISWPYEEASFLRFTEAMELFFLEAREIVDGLLGNAKAPDHDFVEQLFFYQKNIVKHFNDVDGERRIDVNYNFPEYVRGIKSGNPEPLVRGEFRYLVNIQSAAKGDKVQFSRDVVWYGRKGGIYCYSVHRY